jgi:hypothetical protein
MCRIPEPVFGRVLISESYASSLSGALVARRPPARDIPKYTAVAKLAGIKFD